MTLQPSGAPLWAAYDVALLDLDGVVYVGGDAVPHAAEALSQARDAGMRRAFVTNNASRTPATVAEHLTRLGVPAGPAEVVTSAQAAATLVAGIVPPGSAVLLVGGDGLRVALQELGLRPVSSLAEGPAAVVQGFSPDLAWPLLSEGAIAVARGLPWVASNLDLTVPTPRGRAPGNGAFVELLRSVSPARPLVAGKPELPLHHEAVRRSGARRPLMVGDRLDTDIEGAVRAGTDSLLVLTGVTGVVELVRARARQRPSYLGLDLRSLGRRHPLVDVDCTGAHCQGWTIVVGTGSVACTTQGVEPLDGLRALSAACWAEQDRGGDVPDGNGAGTPVELGEVLLARAVAG